MFTTIRVPQPLDVILVDAVDDSIAENGFHNELLIWSVFE
jgi:hypothetical protein